MLRQPSPTKAIQNGIYNPLHIHQHLTTKGPQISSASTVTKAYKAPRPLTNTRRHHKGPHLTYRHRSCSQQAKSGHAVRKPRLQDSMLNHLKLSRYLSSGWPTSGHMPLLKVVDSTCSLCTEDSQTVEYLPQRRPGT